MPAENGMPENEDVKKKALLRLAVAGVVTASALGALWWLDQTGGERKEQPAALPSPIVAAPQAEATPPETAAPPDAAIPQPAPQSEDSSSDEQPLDTPPPPKVSNTPVVQPRAAQISPDKQPPNQPAPGTRPAALQAAPAAAPAPQALPQNAPVSGKGYVVQLGVFSNPENAHELVTRLQKLGVKAHMEARVQLGPFLNRAEAEKAQAEMRKLGFNAMLALPYAAVPATK